MPEVRVGHDLEGQAGERLVVARLRTMTSSSSLDRVALDAVDVERRGQVLDHRVEQRLDALVLERRAAEHGGDLVGERGATDRGLELLDRELALLEEHLHHLVVGVGERLEQLLAVLGGLRRRRSAGISSIS